MIRIILGVLLMVAGFAVLFLFITGPENPLVQQVMVSLHCKDGETFTRTFGAYEDNPGSNSDGYPVYFACADARGRERDVTGEGVVSLMIGFIVPFIAGLLLAMWGGFSLMWKATRKIASAALGGMGDPYGQNSAYGQSGVSPSMQYTNVAGQPIRTTTTSFVDSNGQPVDASNLTPEQLQKVQKALGALGMNMPITGATGATVTTSSFSTGAKINSGADLVAQLQQLEEARNQNLITQEEYDRMRKEILDRLA